MSYEFPKDFLWGAAASSHQVEGDNFYNDWWQWEQAGRLIDRSGKACDHYNRFRDDFRLAKELGHNAHRLGLEWSRLEREEGAWDRNAWEHYKAVAHELKALGIEPIVTLNHFSMPVWFAEKGGWKSPDAPELFSRFAARAIEELGDVVRYWIPINEPYILAFLGHFYGKWPPGEKSFINALLVMRNMLRSHVEAYKRMHEIGDATSGIKRPLVGAAHAVTAFHPCRWYWPPDRVASFFRNRFYNHSFIRSAVRGYCSLPFISGEKLAAKRAVDFIGLNYYFRQFIHYSPPFTEKFYPLGDVCDLAHHKNTGPTTDMGWEVYPEGLYEVIKNFSRYNLPIMVTENGIGTTDDRFREKYLKSHLIQLSRALKSGVNVIGYLHWSLMDNYEWADGYAKRFGLIGINYDTQERTVRDSARYYAQVIRSGRVLD
jgi:beta-glucosidase